MKCFGNENLYVNRACIHIIIIIIIAIYRKVNIIKIIAIVVNIHLIPGKGQC